MGILKICSYDVKRGGKNNSKCDRKNLKNSRYSVNNSIQNTVRIIFRAYIPLPEQINNESEDDSNFLVIQNESESIRCGINKKSDLFNLLIYSSSTIGNT